MDAMSAGDDRHETPESLLDAIRFGPTLGTSDEERSVNPPG